MVKFGANCRPFLLVRRVDFFLERVLRSPVITSAHAFYLSLRITPVAAFFGRRSSYTQRALEFLEKVAGLLSRYLRFLPHRRESRAATRTWIGRVDLVEPGHDYS